MLYGGKGNDSLTGGTGADNSHGVRPTRHAGLSVHRYRHRLRPRPTARPARPALTCWWAGTPEHRPVHRGRGVGRKHHALHISSTGAFAGNGTWTTVRRTGHRAHRCDLDGYSRTSCSRCSTRATRHRLIECGPALRIRGAWPAARTGPPRRRNRSRCFFTLNASRMDHCRPLVGLTRLLGHPVRPGAGGADHAQCGGISASLAEVLRPRLRQQARRARTRPVT